MNETTLTPPDRALYLYCLARPESLSALQEARPPGVDERTPLMTLADETGAVAAVISEVNPAEFSEHNLQDLSWLGPRAQRHEAVVTQVMGSSPVLPVKFGTLFHSRVSLQSFMGRHRAAIVLALETLRDKSEWSAKAYLNSTVARTSVIASDPQIQSRLATLPESPGARYIQQRQLDALIETALNAWLTGVTQALHQALIPHAVGSKPLRCHPGAVTGRPERMIMNTAFLVRAEALDDFRAELTRQQAAYTDHGLSLEWQGPWPPYNFCPALTEDGT